MQQDPLQSSKSNHDLPDNHELSLQLLSTDQEERITELHDCLSDEFNKMPYKLYKFWLIFSLPLGLGSMYGVIRDFKRGDTAALACQGDLLMMIGLFPFIFACGQMLWGIMNRKAKIVQQSLSKFQWSFALFMTGFLLILWGVDDYGIYFFGSKAGIFTFYVPAVSFTVHFVCGNKVIVALRNNYQMTMTRQKESTASTKNEEVMKFDEELQASRYFVFKCWLKFLVVSELVRICFYMFYSCFRFGQEMGAHLLLQLIAVVGLSLSALLLIFSCFQIMTAMQRKLPSRSQTAKILLKLCLVAALIAYVCLAREFEVILIAELKTLFETPNLALLAVCVLSPIVTLIGAVNVHNILEKRDKIAKLSNYTDDESYL